MNELIIKGTIIGFSISFVIASIYLLMWVGSIKLKKIIEMSNPWYFVKEYLEE